jgi:hypothetical protein
MCIYFFKNNYVRECAVHTVLMRCVVTIESCIFCFILYCGRLLIYFSGTAGFLTSPPFYPTHLLQTDQIYFILFFYKQTTWSTFNCTLCVALNSKANHVNLIIGGDNVSFLSKGTGKRNAVYWRFQNKDYSTFFWADVFCDTGLMFHRLFETSFFSKTKWQSSVILLFFPGSFSRISFC